MKISTHPTFSALSSTIARITFGLFIGICLLASSAFAGPGGLDPAFGQGGVALTEFGGPNKVTGYGMTIQSDGKILIVGGGNIGLYLARYLPDGTLDASFGTGGKVALTSITGMSEGYFTKVAVMSDGKILVGGTVLPSVNGPGSLLQFALVKLTSAGALDTTFGSGGLALGGSSGADQTLTGMEVLPSGKILVGGTTEIYGQYAGIVFSMLRFTAVGAVDDTFDPGNGSHNPNFRARSNASDYCNGMAVQSDGKIILAGTSEGASKTDFAILRFLVTDTYQGFQPPFDNTFGTADGRVIISFTPYDDECEDMIRLSDGKIIMVGSANGDVAIARLTADGLLDTSFDTDGKVTTDLGDTNDTARDVAVQSDGKIVIAATTGGGNFHLIRYNSNGSLDTSFRLTGKAEDDLGIFDKAAAVAVQSDGKIVAAGSAVLGFAAVRYDVEPGPEITLKGNGKTIFSNATVTDTANNTHFGTVALASSPVTKTFQIVSEGTAALNLTGTPRVTVSGSSSFSVTAQPAVTTLSPGANTSFSITFTPEVQGNATATVSIANNDTGESPHIFAISGRVPDPEIVVINVTDGSPGVDLTSGAATLDFGLSVTGATVTRLLEVRNYGELPLNVEAMSISGAQAADFKVSTYVDLPASLTTGGFVPLVVTYRPSVAGASGATLSIPNNDTSDNESPFEIELLGAGTNTRQVATFTGTDSVSGGWVAGDFFTFGKVGSAGDTNNWLSTEAPNKATDGNINTKFLIFKGSNTGLILSPANPTIAYNRLAFTTANDSAERDPASYEIYGNVAPLPVFPETSFDLTSLTLIASGNLSLSDARKAGPAVVHFDNNTAYATYVIVFKTVKNNPATAITQIAEVELSQGMTLPNQVAMASVRGGQLLGNTFTFGAIRGTTDPEANNWPAAEAPDYAFDGSVGSKFLLFRNNGAGLIVSPSAGPAPVNSLSFWTANDARERDPKSYQVYGSTAPVTGNSGTLDVSTSPWTMIQETTDLILPEGRLEGPTTVSFTNYTAYASYLVVFPEVFDAGGTQVTQIADVAFGFTPPSIEPSGTDKTLAVESGSTTTLTLADWEFSDGDVPPDNFVAVDITSFPTAGTLQVDGSDLTELMSVSLSTSVVTFTAPAGTGSASFTFQVQDDGFTGFNIDSTPNTLTFNYVPANVAPSDITLTNASIAENNAAGATVGTLNAVDGNAPDTHTFSLVAGDGDYDNAAFTIAGKLLKLNAAADFETQSSYMIRVWATDSGAGNLTFEKSLTVSITDVTIPQVITFAPPGAKVFGDPDFNVSASGGASGQPVTFSISSGPATISGNTVSIIGAGDVTVSAAQAGSGDYAAASPVERTFTVGKGSQTIVFTSPPSANVRATVTLGATGGASGNPVTFSVASGPGSLAGNVLSFSATGTVEITASQAGNENYLAAADVTRSIAATLAAPTVTTPTNADITSSSALLGGTISSDGGAAITERGIVYSLLSDNSNPLIGGNGVTKVIASATTNVFTTSATGLAANKEYFFKAYASNSEGTSYSSADLFTTMAAVETISIGGTTVLSVPNFGDNTIVTTPLTGETVITGTVDGETITDGLSFTLPPGKVVTDAVLRITNYVAAVPRTDGGYNFTGSRAVTYSSNSQYDSFDDETDGEAVVDMMTRCATPTFSFSINAPDATSEKMVNNGGFVDFDTEITFGSARYEMVLQIGDANTTNQLSDLTSSNSTLSPAFESGVTSYSTTVPFTQSFIELTPTWSSPTLYVTRQVNGGGGGETASGFSQQLSLLVGENTVIYHACAQDGSETIYTVNITREESNVAPTFSGYTFSTPKDTTAEVALAKILARAADSDGGTLTISGVSGTSSQGGSVGLGSGSVDYSPASGFTGLDTFSVTISDGQGGTVTGNITVSVSDSGDASLNQQLTFQPNGDVAVLFMGIPGQEYEIRRSTDLVTWTTIQTVTAAPDGTVPWLDSDPPVGEAYYSTFVSDNSNK